jgi:hypothetical protein
LFAALRSLAGRYVNEAITAVISARRKARVVTVTQQEGRRRAADQIQLFFSPLPLLSRDT